jgi:hypothetical protein
VGEQGRRRLVAHRLEQSEPDERDAERASVGAVAVAFEEVDDPLVDARDARP